MNKKYLQNAIARSDLVIVFFVLRFVRKPIFIKQPNRWIDSDIYM